MSFPLSFQRANKNIRVLLQTFEKQILVQCCIAYRNQALDLPSQATGS